MPRLQVLQVRHYAVGPFEFVENARCSMLLVAVAGEQHLSKVGRVSQLTDLTMLQSDPCGFLHVLHLPPLSESKLPIRRGTCVKRAC